jgi:hypothetical protein
MMPDNFSADEAVERCQAIFAHAWMVRTFIKHSPEAEEFPELMQLARTVFDVARSLEIRVHDPAAYLQQLRKKFRRLRDAAAQFRQDAPRASTHTNFQQAVLSMDACVREWERILQRCEFAPATMPNRGLEPYASVSLTKEIAEPAHDEGGPA